MHLPLWDVKLLFEGFHLQFKVDRLQIIVVAKKCIRKYSVPLSERCQTPFEGFHLQGLQVIHE